MMRYKSSNLLLLLLLLLLTNSHPASIRIYSTD